MENFKFKLWDSSGRAITKCKGDMKRIQKELNSVLNKLK